MKKRIFCAVLALILTLIALPACSGTGLYTSGQGELKVVATVFTPFDIAREVTGGLACLTLLQSNGADLHDYSPTVSAISALSEADIFICVGGVSDAWVDDAVKACANPDLTVIKLTELCRGELTELEGHCHGQYCEEHHGHSHGEHEHEHEHSADDGHGHVSDEHVWLSFANAAVITDTVASVCAEKDAQNASVYSQNAVSYKARLSKLRADAENAVAQSEKKTLVFADRFPFIYLTRELGICHYAAFSGCSSETDAAFATAVRLIDAVRHGSLGCVLVTESSDRSLAESIRTATDCDILTLNSLQTVTAAQIEDGVTYLSVMEENVRVLTEALAS